VFRTNFLRPKTIGIIPAQGYRPEEKQSVKALQWIKYVAQLEGVHIQHARNGGEKTINQYRVDGYYETKDGEKVVMGHTRPISSHRHNVKSAILFGGGNFRDCRNPIIYRVYR
jgi:ABC-type uncharacterized transport system ATPase subunit